VLVEDSVDYDGDDGGEISTSARFGNEDEERAGLKYRTRSNVSIPCPDLKHFGK